MILAREQVIEALGHVTSQPRHACKYTHRIGIVLRLEVEREETVTQDRAVRLRATRMTRKPARNAAASSRPYAEIDGPPPNDALSMRIRTQAARAALPPTAAQVKSGRKL